MKPYFKSIQLKPLLVSLAISLGTGAISAFISSGSMDAYKNLNQPVLAPPAWIFSVVWTVLFLLMGISAYLVYISPASHEEKREALTVYAVQLIVNFFWPVLFFNLEARLLAFFWLLLLIVLIIIMIKKFYETCPIAGLLQIPYLLWCIFAAYLNLAIYLSNR